MSQGDGLRGCLFIICLVKALRTLPDRVDNGHVTSEHSYAVSFKSTLPYEYIDSDGTDLINDCVEKKKRHLQLVSYTFVEFNLQINDTKTEKKRSDKEKEWRTTKKLGSLMGDQEDILRRYQLSTTALHNLNDMWIR